MKFSTILLDPPVPFETWSTPKPEYGTASSYYRLMTWRDLGDLGPWIDAVAADDCALFLWLCPPLLRETLAMVDAWNTGQPKRRQWIYKTKAFCWIKLNTQDMTPFTGMGYWTRANSEDVLLFTRGNAKRKRKDVPQIITTHDTWKTQTIACGRGKHSQKPEQVQDAIERLVGGPYLEMFARRRRPNWTCVGDAVDGLDIRESLRRLAHDEPLPQLVSSLLDWEIV